ncbi:hypothetical protein HK096_007933, partial [Nowakowskiella sp. JEL0078]
MSDVAKRTSNPIRVIVDQMAAQPNPLKPTISLALGDPTTFGNLPPHSSTEEAVAKVLASKKFNGYPPSVGHAFAREAVAEKFTRPEAPLTANDVVLASGCCDAVNIAIGALAGNGQNILIPAPGFSLYEVLANNKGIEPRFYDLLPERSWEIDLEHLESLIDDNTAALVVINPSNPCGSVYSKNHLLAIISSIAEKYKIPIVADEIYADMVFKGFEFHPMATLTETVPILSVGGVSKRYLVPG